MTTILAAQQCRSLWAGGHPPHTDHHPH
jgi:hypothetical protein